MDSYSLCLISLFALERILERPGTPLSGVKYLERQRASEGLREDDTGVQAFLSVTRHSEMP